eukprot:comp19753_c0_seq1/m.23599 comp19753_c0_seq1/g.23599  ORF comp19753_c0_seq1/g.23599 comp19753_c0_seq1/m.23599 type:complete len:567 (-) comp19753_c0_seq1:281-1981(-)
MVVVKGSGGSASPPRKKSRLDPADGEAMPLALDESAATDGNMPASSCADGGERGLVWQEELVRLMVQSMRSMGYRRSAEHLESESGYRLESASVGQFRSAVLQGKWDDVISYMGQVPAAEDSLNSIRFLVYEQKFLEHLERQQVEEALTCLRTDLTPLDIHHDRLHTLSSLMMCQDAQDLRHTANWDGAEGTSRHTLLRKLQEYFPANQMIPEGRLETLLDQAQALQMQQCLYHNISDPRPSLLTDHICDRGSLPTETLFVFTDHQDEVWYVKFSNDGTRLASASKDNTCIVWDIKRMCSVHTLRGHQKAVSFVAWRPDDTMLLTCSSDMTLRLWNTQTGVCIDSIHKHTDSVTVCAWCPDGERFVSASLDQKTHLWALDGTLLHTWTGARINDMAITSDGERMVAICHEKKIRIYDLDGKHESFISETDSITSLSLSSDDRYIIVNISAEEIHLWDLAKQRLVMKYYGQKQGKYVIRSCFGGTNDTFVASGSEDANVHIWHRETASVLEVLHGHTSTVNSVAWNPKDPQMFASASDDRTIRLWGPPKAKHAPGTVAREKRPHSSP